jgi:hypothetical protein
MIYNNHAVQCDHERCSSSLPCLIPDPQPLASKQLPAPPEIDLPGQTLTYLKLLMNDVKQVSKALEITARQMCQGQPKNWDSLFMSTQCYLNPMVMKAITRDFYLITLEDILEAQERVGIMGKCQVWHCGR